MENKNLEGLVEIALSDKVIRFCKTCNEIKNQNFYVYKYNKNPELFELYQCSCGTLEDDVDEKVQEYFNNLLHKN